MDDVHVRCEVGGMKWVWIIALVLCVAIFGIYKLTFPTKSWNQKLTLYIGTPSGPVTASHVIEVNFIERLKMMSWMDSNTFRLRGEALVADLEGQYLFALLGGVEKPIWLTLRRIDKDIGAYDASLRQMKRQTEPLNLPRDLWPRW